MFQQAGFIRTDEVGYTGLTIGVTGKDDAVIAAIQSESAAQSGLEAGDAITAVDGRSVKPTPGRIATKAVFGPRGEALHLKVRRAGAELEISLTRSAQNAPQGPKSPNFFLMVRPMIDWRGEFIPCMGAGPAAPVVFEYCNKHFKPFGFIKTGEFGSTGFQLNLEREDSAIVSAVEPDSAAAKAGLQEGDEIVAVEGQPLTGSAGEAAKEQLFGKIGDQFHVTVRRGGADKTFVLQLAAKPAA
jgi:C-terminal processing protease CtpA/Prc